MNNVFLTFILQKLCLQLLKTAPCEQIVNQCQKIVHILYNNIILYKLYFSKSMHPPAWQNLDKDLCDQFALDAYLIIYFSTMCLVLHEIFY